MSGRRSEFEPRIIAFCCNWCAYAGADLAGTSRIQYPPTVRIIRVMCSGMVDMSYILKAFEAGADGVLVAGCHPGTCHYLTGNLKAEKEVGRTRKLLDVIGIGADRLRLEWISASEGEKFARVVREFTEHLKRTGPSPLKLVPLSRATSGCSGPPPATEVGRVPSFADRAMAEELMWRCLGCHICHATCPGDVRISEVVRAARTKAPRDHVDLLCAHAAVPLMWARMMANPALKPNRLGWLPEGARISGRGDVLYFVGCLPQYDAMLEEMNLNSVRIAKAAVSVMNKLGIEPAVLSDERCCGHDLAWTGDVENFERLARLNVEMIRASGAEKVVTACPECYRTLKLDYPDVLGDMGFDVMHISELLCEAIDEGKLRFDEGLARRVTYQDSCRLGRHMGIYEEPRKLIRAIPGLELVEMGRNRDEAACCGTSAWLLCGEVSKRLQLERLKEAKQTGAEQLVVGCHKCRAHFMCVMEEKLPPGYQDVKIPVVELTELIAEALGIELG